MEYKQRVDGFSLIELIIIVVIIGVLALNLVPFSLKAISRVELERAARMVASDIRYGENKALTEQNDLYRIQFLTDSNAYRKYFNSTNPNSYKLVKMPDGIMLNSAVFGSTNPKLYFNKRGTVTVGGSVALTDNHGNWMFVRVAPVTGRVRIERVEN